jgi:tripartite-type tricarboxylate transporter receptor subunit TctC
MKSIHRLAWGLLGLAVLLPSSVLAQEFPAQLVRIVVPYPAGGGVDGLARPLAELLSRLWRQTVIVENKSGASTMLGGELVARSPADGHTLFFTSDSSITSNPHLFKKAPLDPIKDLAPVTKIMNLHQMVVIHPSVQANTMQELVQLAKREPNALNYGSYGIGSQPNLLYETLKMKTGIQILHVPFRGIAPALTATIANTVQMTLSGPATSRGYFAAGQLKPLAIGREERLKEFPKVPTLRETSYPEIEPRSWFGLFAPAGTPREIVNKIRKDVAAILYDPEFRKRYVERMGYTGGGDTPEEFAKFIQTDLAEKGRMIADASIELR